MIRSSRYRGALQTVQLNDGKELSMFLPPYTADLGECPSGTQEIRLTLWGHRRNAFGPVHLADLKETWIGPDAWRSTGDRWCYDYCIAEEGILATPEIREI